MSKALNKTIEGKVIELWIRLDRRGNQNAANILNDHQSMETEVAFSIADQSHLFPDMLVQQAGLHNHDRRFIIQNTESNSSSNSLLRPL